MWVKVGHWFVCMHLLAGAEVIWLYFWIHASLNSHCCRWSAFSVTSVVKVTVFQSVTFYGSSMLSGSVPAGQPLEIEGASQPGIISKNGLVLFGNDGKAVSVTSDFLYSVWFCWPGLCSSIIETDQNNLCSLLLWVHTPRSAPSEEPAVWRWKDDSCFQVLLLWRELICGAD